MSDKAGQDNAALSPLVILFVVSIVQFLIPFMSSAVDVALPTIGKEFGASAAQLSIIQLAYVFAIVVLMLPMGRFADIHGRKRIFIVGIILVTLSTFALGWTRGVATFILFHFLQGAGASMIISNGIAILSSVFPPQRRGRAIGIITAFAYVGLAAGPSLAGVIITQLGWRWLLYLMVPFQLIALFLTVLKLKDEWADSKGEKFDWIGTAIYMIALSMVVVGISQFRRLDFAEGITVIGLIGVAIFLKVEAGMDMPLLDTRLFSNNRVFTFSNICAMINYGASFGAIFLFTLYLQFVKGLSAQQAGFVLTVQPCFQALLSPMAGRWADAFSPLRMATMGMAICAIALICAAFIGADSNLISIMTIMALLGIGFGVFASPNMTAILASVKPHQYGATSSIYATVRPVGVLTTTAINTVILSLVMGDHPVTVDNRLEFVLSMRLCLMVFTLMCIVGVAFSTIRNQTATTAYKETPNI